METNDITLIDEAVIIEKARKGLALIASGEERTIEGWLMYGEALNVGRAMFPKGDNKRFSEWVTTVNLSVANDHDKLAAMWAAEFPEDFEATRKAFPKVRTVRGLHAKFKSPPKVKATPEDILTMQKLDTLAKRGATAGERQAAQLKLDKMREVISVSDKVFEEYYAPLIPRNKQEAKEIIAKTILKDLTEKRASAYIRLLLNHYCDGDFHEMLEFLEEMKTNEANNL